MNILRLKAVLLSTFLGASLVAVAFVAGTSSAAGPSSLPLMAKPSHVNFGRVPDLTHTDVTIVFTNVSKEDVTPYDDAFAGDATDPPFGAIAGSDCFKTLHPGDTCSFTLKFDNTNTLSPGTYQGFFQLRATGPVVVGEAHLRGVAL